MPVEPLHGVRVVTIAVNLPGPVAAARLAALGAHVTKVEPPTGDPARWVSDEWYRTLSSRQDVVTLDLKADDGMAALHALLSEAQVLLTSHRPSALARLGLSWADLTARHPRLSQVAIVGQAGDLAERPGHDLTYQAESGLLSGPEMPRSLLADLGGAERAVTAVLAAALDLHLHGQVSYTEVALESVAHDLAAPYRLGVTQPDGLLGGALPAYGIYATADGHIALAALEPHFQARLSEALGRTLTRAALEDVFAQRTSAEWQAWADAHDIPLAAIS